MTARHNMACGRLAALLLLCLALVGGSFGQQSARQQATAAAAPPGLPCSALVDTDTPERELQLSKLDLNLQCLLYSSAVVSS